MVTDIWTRMSFYKTISFNKIQDINKFRLYKLDQSICVIPLFRWKLNISTISLRCTLLYSLHSMYMLCTILLNLYSYRALSPQNNTKMFLIFKIVRGENVSNCIWKLIITFSENSTTFECVCVCGFLLQFFFFRADVFFFVLFNLTNILTMHVVFQFWVFFFNVIWNDDVISLLCRYYSL